MVAVSNDQSISVYGGHNANVTFRNGENYHVIELERLKCDRHYMWHDKSDAQFASDLASCVDVAERFWSIDSKATFDNCCYGINGAAHLETLKSQIRSTNFNQYNHHESHAACSFYQSGFTEALVVSFDGGGNDGVFNFYHFTYGKRPRLVWKSNINLGHAYMITGYPISEIRGQKGGLPHDLSIAGKLMGLVGYGSVRGEWTGALQQFYRSNRWDLRALGRTIGVPLSINSLSGMTAYDLATSSQAVFEQEFAAVFNAAYEASPMLRRLPVCLSGGAALNVILNEQLLGALDVGIFVPPNPDDGGLSLGQLFLAEPPKEPVTDIKFRGMPLLDRDKLAYYVNARGAKTATSADIAKLLTTGAIVGIVNGDSEVGPRALGNRSIVCLPSIPGMKDKLNHEVKFRESFRPFAPVAIDDEAGDYFVLKTQNRSAYEFMSYAPVVKSEWHTRLAAITHVDGSSRLQTVSRSIPADRTFCDILASLSELGAVPVILNTSFNTKSKPILSTIKEALNVLDTTGLDYVYCCGFLFGRKNP